MDNHFVPNLTWGPAFVQAFTHATELPLHVHLMVDKPASWIDRLNLRSQDLFIFHYEACTPPETIKKIIEQLKNKSIKIGIAISPKTPIDPIFEYVSLLDHVLIMSVNPGFSGQTFMPETLKKVTPLLEKRATQKLNFTIGMDGGINHTNIQQLKIAGIEEIAAASAVFTQKDPVYALQKLYKAAQ
jgi:ribulose-phosphate 3-epimerase